MCCGLLGAALAGFVVAVASMTLPALVRARTQTVSSARAAIGREADPLWQRLYLDFFLLAAGALFYWQSAASGYQVVLAPEGVPQSSVHYEAFLGPLLFWLGGSLLAMRLARSLLLRWRAGVQLAVRPLAGPLSPVVSASLSRQHKLVVRGIALVLAFSFGIATAVFNSTYNAQAIVDAQLTNGADVTVTGQTASQPSRPLAQFRAIPGVTDAGAMQHRFAYVGNDLQDLYGIDAASITASRRCRTPSLEMATPKRR